MAFKRNQITKIMEEVTGLQTEFEDSSAAPRSFSIQAVNADLQQQQEAAIRRAQGSDQTTRTTGLFPGSGFGRGAIGLFGRGAIVTDTVGKRRTRA